MDASEFTTEEFGTLVDITDKNGKKHKAYLPKTIPRARNVSSAVARQLTRATRALAELEAHVESLPRPEFFLEPFRVREAVLSSSIEGTVTTVPDALVHQVPGMLDPTHDHDGNAVRNYDEALKNGLEWLEQGRPMGEHLIRSIHSDLARMDAALLPYAGKLRTQQVAIGPPGAQENLEEATFIPPPPEMVQSCFDDYLRYASEKEADEYLLRVAIMHYQFETIHPFGDGNGRVGRMLIPLQMVNEGVLKKPWFYPSYELQRNKTEYTTRLYRVSAKGEMDAWLEFFLKAVTSSSNDMLNRVRAMRDLFGTYERRIIGRGEYPLRALRILFGFPAFIASKVAKELQCSLDTARAAIDVLEKEGVVRKIPGALKFGQRGRPPTLYFCDGIVDVLDKPRDVH